MHYFKLIFLGIILLSNHLLAQEKLSFISADELQSESSQIFLFDVSKDSVFKAGHIEGAFHLSRKDFTEQEDPFYGAIGKKSRIEDLLFRYGIKKGDRIVAYDHKGGCDAARFWWVLSYYGHENVQILEGGYTSWGDRSGNFRTIEQLSVQDKYHFEETRDDIVATKEEVIAALEDDQIVLVDTRTLDEYTGLTQKDPATRSGRIPGAVHIDWASCIKYDEDQMLKTKDELKNLFAWKGVTPDKEVICYCHTATRSSFTFMVLTDILGYEKVKNYDGSWVEWSLDNSLPIESGPVPDYAYSSYTDIFWNSFNGYANYLWNQITFTSQPWYENYFWFLVILSLLVWLLEIIFPWRKDQPIFRKDFWLDFFFMFFNFYIFNLVIFLAFSKFVTKGFYDLTDVDVTGVSVFDMSELAWGWQMLIFFVATDFIQWFTHVCLHRFTFLWRFHKVHHSVVQMGFAAHLRYHWMETVVYTPMKFLAVMFIGGFAPDQAFIIYFFNIAIGHLNHANINVEYGPLKYVLNNPKMHIWHHAKELPEDRRYGVNFGITLSIWDYIFKKNYVPRSGRDIPLGFPNIEKYPKGFFGLIFSGFGKTKDEEVTNEKA